MTESSNTPGPRSPWRKVSADVLTAHLEDEAVLLHLKSKRYFRLNETGAAVWKCLERGLDRAAIVASLTEEFDVDSDTALAEVDRIIADFDSKELLD